MMAPTSATDGEGHRKREKMNMEIPRIHQVMEGFFMIRVMGAMRMRLLPSSERHFDRAVTSAMVAIISINSFAA